DTYCADYCRGRTPRARSHGALRAAWNQRAGNSAADGSGWNLASSHLAALGSHRRANRTVVGAISVLHRYLVTGTDTDVGKTRVTAALAKALRVSGETPTVIKLVQTGLDPGVPGDAALAGKLSGSKHVELARFRKPADPWSAAIAEGTPTVHAEDLARIIEGVKGPVVAEGAGGLA